MWSIPAVLMWSICLKKGLADSKPWRKGEDVDDILDIRVSGLARAESIMNGPDGTAQKLLQNDPNNPNSPRKRRLRPALVWVCQKHYGEL